MQSRSEICSAIDIFLDSALPSAIESLIGVGDIKGFTTNPTLLSKSGEKSISSFISKISPFLGKKPLSLEVMSDDPDELINQARKLHLMYENTFVKVPICRKDGTSLVSIIQQLNNEGIKLNVTAVFSTEQIDSLINLCKNSKTPLFVSIFAGRIADSGQNPEKFFRYAEKLKSSFVKLLWASTREVYNVIQAIECGADIITVSPEILDRMSNIGKDLHVFSIETVQMFLKDAHISGMKVN